jgi:hypothetical protein
LIRRAPPPSLLPSAVAYDARAHRFPSLPGRGLARSARRRKRRRRAFPPAGPAAREVGSRG